MAMLSPHRDGAGDEIARHGHDRQPSQERGV
jgi:hypothetical protein